MKVFVLLCAVGLAVGGHVGTVTTQYHAQDELGQYAYGYSGGPSAKHEERGIDGITRGGYSYLDAHGLVQSAAYVSDQHNGFRVAATNLPVGPAVPDDRVVAAVAAPAVVAAAAPAVVASAPAVVEARSVLAGPLAAPVVSAGPLAYAGHGAVAPALAYAGHGAVAPALAYSGHAAVAALPATSVSTIATAPGLTATRVITPVQDTVSVNTLGHGLLHGLHRLRRSLYPGLALAHGGVWAAHAAPYVGPLASAPVETLAPTGHDTLAVSAARAAHAHAVAATTTRDVLNGAAPWGLYGAGVHAAAAPWGVYAAGVPAITAHGVPLDTPAVAAAKVAHAAAHVAAAHRSGEDVHRRVRRGSWSHVAGPPVALTVLGGPVLALPVVAHPLAAQAAVFSAPPPPASTASADSPVHYAQEVITRSDYGYDDAAPAQAPGHLDSHDSDRARVHPQLVNLADDRSLFRADPEILRVFNTAHVAKL